jgi:hypothetical protein
MAKEIVNLKDALEEANLRYSKLSEDKKNKENYFQIMRNIFHYFGKAIGYITLTGFIKDINKLRKENNKTKAKSTTIYMRTDENGGQCFTEKQVIKLNLNKNSY